MKKFGSDIICQQIKSHGIDYIAINPGSSIGGIHDSMVHNDDAPGLVFCLHEEIAVAVAHGYAKASGKPMAVGVHANVGLYHASMAVFNAWCDRVPMLVIGGSGPLESDKRRPWIDWIHASSHQADIVADCTKWHEMPTTLPAALETIARGVEITTQAPSAPVYLTLSSTLQEVEITGREAEYPLQTAHPAEHQVASGAALAKLAALIGEARKPAVVVDYMDGRDGRDKALLAFADKIGAAVFDLGGRYNFPTHSYLSLSGAESQFLRDADLVILLDVQDAHGTLGALDAAKKYQSHLQPGARVVSIGTRDLLVSKAYADYHKFICFEQKILADSGTVIQQLNGLLAPDTSHDAVRHRRKQEIHQQREEIKSQWRRDSSFEPGSPINLPRATRGIWNALQGHRFALTNCGGLAVRAWVKRLFEFDNDRKSFVGINSGGAGLGYGIGASLGACLALGDKVDLCVNIQNDGDLLYTPSALWSIAHHQQPLLTVIFNNRSYGLTKAVSKRVAAARGRDTDLNPGNCFINPEIDFVAMAKSYGIPATQKVVSMAELEKELAVGVEYVARNRKPYIIEAILED
jgi:acetolactate synthase-1/2/3 large subunit